MGIASDFTFGGGSIILRAVVVIVNRVSVLSSHKDTVRLTIELFSNILLSKLLCGQSFNTQLTTTVFVADTVRICPKQHHTNWYSQYYRIIVLFTPPPVVLLVHKPRKLITIYQEQIQGRISEQILLWVQTQIRGSSLPYISYFLLLPSTSLQRQ